MDKAYTDFQAGVGSFETLLQSVLAATNAAQEELRTEKKRLAEERVAFEEEKGRIAQVTSTADLSISAFCFCSCHGNALLSKPLRSGRGPSCCCSEKP